MGNSNSECRSASQAKNTEEQSNENFCHSNYDIVKKKVIDERERRNSNKQAAIFIKNESSFDLKYICSGSKSGRFFSRLENTFADEKKDPKTPGSICSKHTGGIVHSRLAGGFCGSVGYVSFGIDTPGREYVGAIGWGVSAFDSKNKAGMEIRAADGNSDGFGNINGHYLSPTGVVSDMDQFLNVEANPVNDNENTYFSSKCAMFQFNCAFNNNSWADYDIIVTDTELGEKAAKLKKASMSP